MATVRCPKCGAINPNGRRRLGRCYQCREWLGKCRYCRHYDPRLSDCTSLSRRTDEHVLDADEVLNCPDFSSALVNGLSPLPRAGSFLTTVSLVGILALGALGAFLVIRSFTKETPSVTLRVVVDSPPSIIQDEPLQVTVMVANQGENPAQDVRVIISGRGIAYLVCQYVTPEECFLEATPKAVTAAFGDMAPGSMQSVAFRFLPTRACNLSLSAHVTAANTPLPAVSRIECQVLP